MDNNIENIKDMRCPNCRGNNIAINENKYIYVWYSVIVILGFLIRGIIGGLFGVLISFLLLGRKVKIVCSDCGHAGKIVATQEYREYTRSKLIEKDRKYFWFWIGATLLFVIVVVLFIKIF